MSTQPQDTVAAEPLLEGDYEVKEVPTTTALMAFMAAEIDVQISTAKNYPRDMALFRRKVLALATVSQEIAESCTYALPRAGKAITGPSVRFAEIVQTAYGNLRVGGRIVSNDGRRITAQGVCHDLESNVARTIEVSRSVMQHVYDWSGGKKRKTGRMEPMNEDMQVLIGNACIAIATRNALFQVVPRAHWFEAYEKVQEMAKGDLATLPARRAKAFDFFKARGVKEEDILRVLEVGSIEEVDLDRLAVLSSMKAALSNKEATLEGLFPPLTGRQKADAATKSAEEKLKKSGNGAKDTASQMEKDLNQPPKSPTA